MCVFLQCAVIILGKVSFGFFGSSTLPLSAYDKMISEAMHFILACYNMSHCQDLTQARQELWKIKMAKCLAGPPKLCSLPPTTEAFTENAKRAHLQLAVWYHALDSEPPHLDPKNHGWTRKEDSTSLCPSVIPQGTHLAPDELIRLIKCSCASTKKKHANLGNVHVCQLAYLAHYFVLVRVVYCVITDLQLHISMMTNLIQ